MLNQCLLNVPPPLFTLSTTDHLPLFTFLFGPALPCSDCINCCSLMCNLWVHSRLRPALCRSVHQFTGVLWINTWPQQTAPQDLNDFLQQLMKSDVVSGGWTPTGAAGDGGSLWTEPDWCVSPESFYINEPASGLYFRLKFSQFDLFCEFCLHFFF